MPIFEPTFPDDDSIKSRITSKLRGLGVSKFKIKEPIKGPIVTGYPIELGIEVPISKVMNRSEDLALACGVDSVDIRRIGNEVVVFVPNKDREVIEFHKSLFWYLTNEEVEKMNLPILLGVDYTGQNSVIELTEQPHILISGSTGSGKSIFETNIIASLAMFKNENELHFYLVDTKNVDLTLFETLPHVKMMAKNVDDWYSLTQALSYEVDSRNGLLAAKGVRNIHEYNQLDSIEKLPFIVVLIDELSDLIEKDKAERYGIKDYPYPKVIDSIKRLIQVCRSAGMHFIACTQRTSVDVVNGVVKANFPTRISMRLPSGVDSRTILDEKGAENLLGKGDMLIKSQESDLLKRYHAPFIRIEDIKIILDQREMLKQGFEDMKGKMLS
jgi:DNA segregation ATPase FtsK/SpoIIIE, S-DNA-T family